MKLKQYAVGKLLPLVFTASALKMGAYVCQNSCPYPDDSLPLNCSTWLPESSNCEILGYSAGGGQPVWWYHNVCTWRPWGASICENAIETATNYGEVEETYYS